MAVVRSWRYCENSLKAARLVAEAGASHKVAGRLFLSPHAASSYFGRVFATLAVDSHIQQPTTRRGDDNGTQDRVAGTGARVGDAWQPVLRR